MDHPFADFIGLQVEAGDSGESRCTLNVCEKLLNPHRVVHGGVIYSMADTGMGAALYPSLLPGQICATIEIKMNYYRPVRAGLIVCETTVVNQGKSVANMESNVYADDVLIAKANGNYAIFTPSGKSQ